ncbi:MAG TPA: (deoxy)nucleoside triphosphate pyrophosphohydrolase [Terriglobales bacterium]|nr:(deoxy)nucleoside triphosphate pyrophosphohydrolase [Terriglobales bacterium]
MGVADKPAVKQVVAGVIARDGKVLICQRSKDGPMPLKWEFPGGKIEPQEDAIAALERELDEELGISATIGKRVAHIRHRYRKGHEVELQFYRVLGYEGEMQNRIFEQLRWVERHEIAGFDFLDADHDLVRQIASGEIQL